jgi:hypothetical protein
MQWPERKIEEDSFNRETNPGTNEIKYLSMKKDDFDNV